MEVITSWLPWLLSGGAISWGALAIFAPQVLLVVTPVLKGVIDGTVEYLRTLWNGAMDMLDNSASIVFVATIGTLMYTYGYLGCSCKTTVKEPTKLEKNYSPSKEKEKTIFTNPLGYWR